MSIPLSSTAEASGTPVGDNRPLPLARLLLICGGIYAAQGIIGGLTFQGLPAVLRANQISLDMIGLVFLAMLPWALKFLWAPALEQVRIGSNNLRRSRPIIVIGQLLCVVLLLAIAASGLANFYSVLALLLVLAIVAATVDIACDGFIIEQLSRKNRGWGNTAQMGGAYVGFVIGGGLFLWLTASYGWRGGTMAMALFVAVLMLPFVFVAEPQPQQRIREHRPNLRFALARREIRMGILVLILFDVGIRVTSGLEGPFLVDQGMNLKLIGLLAGFGGAVAGLFGTLIGGFLVRQVSAKWACVVAIVLQAVVVIAFLLAAATDTAAIEMLAPLIIAKSIIMGIGFVSIYSLMMGLVSLRQAGVDFTLFQCVDAAIAALGGFGGSVLAGHFGYVGAFALAAGVSLSAAFLLPSFLLAQLKTSPGDGQEQ